MRTRAITCERALMVLIGEPGDDTRDAEMAARRHARQCPRCCAAYDPALADAVALGAFAAPQTGPAPSLRIGLLAFLLRSHDMRIVQEIRHHGLRTGNDGIGHRSCSER